MPVDFAIAAAICRLRRANLRIVGWGSGDIALPASKQSRIQ
jgi:hypothetical protein